MVSGGASAAAVEDMAAVGAAEGYPPVGRAAFDSKSCAGGQTMDLQMHAWELLLVLVPRSWRGAAGSRMAM